MMIPTFIMSFCFTMLVENARAFGGVLIGRIIAEEDAMAIAHKHGEETRDEEETKQNIHTLLAKRLQQHLGDLGIESGLRCCDGKDETSNEEHDDRVGKRSHDTFVGKQCAYFYL